MGRPRIGREDRLAALRDHEGGAIESAPRTRPSTIGETAAHLAELLAPLPGTLDEIGTRINRHCAVAGRDAELAAMVERIHARTFDLWLAVGRLRDAAGSRP
jgi:hypothetical protein